LLATTAAPSSGKARERVLPQHCAGCASSNERPEGNVMSNRIVQTSEALGRAAERGSEPLIPALCGCRECGTMHLIAAPLIGICAACGAELALLHSVRASQAPDQEPEMLSPFAA